MKDIPLVGPDAVWYVAQNHMDEVIWQGLDAPNTVADDYAVLWRCHIANSRISGTGHWRGALLDCLAHGTLVIEHQPFDNRERQGSVADQLIVKCAEAEICSFPVPIAPQQPHDLPLARDVRDLLRGAGRRARRLALGRFAVEATGFHEVLHCLLEAPSTGVQVDVDSDARGTITAEPEDLALGWRVIRIQPFTHQHLLSVERPAFREDAVALHAPDLARDVIRDRYLQEVPGNALVA